MGTTSERKLGEILIDEQLIDQGDLDLALREQKVSGQRLGSTLVALGCIDEALLAASLSRQVGLPCVNLNHLDVPHKVLGMIPDEIARRNNLLPVKHTEDALYVAMANPRDEAALRQATKAAGGREVRPMVAPEFCLKTAIARHYGPRKKI